MVELWPLCFKYHAQGPAPLSTSTDIGTAVASGSRSCSQTKCYKSDNLNVYRESELIDHLRSALFRNIGLLFRFFRDFLFIRGRGIGFFQFVSRGGGITELRLPCGWCCCSLPFCSCQYICIILHHLKARGGRQHNAAGISSKA